MDTSGERFRKDERLRKRSQFLDVQRQGTRCSSPNLVMYASPNELASSRIGLTVSRKVGNAAIRNLWKRRMREIFRRNKSAFAEGYDFVVIVKHSGSLQDFEALRTELLELASRTLARIHRRTKEQKANGKTG